MMVASKIENRIRKENDIEKAKYSSCRKRRIEFIASSWLRQTLKYGQEPLAPLKFRGLTRRLGVKGLAIVVPYQYHCAMPPKIRELISQLQKAGFKNRGGKGSHRNFTHGKGGRITISGKIGDDAKPYQIKAVEKAVGEVS